MGRRSAVEVLRLLTEAQEIAEAIIALEEATELGQGDFSDDEPGAASA